MHQPRYLSRTYRVGFGEGLVNTSVALCNDRSVIAHPRATCGLRISRTPTSDNLSPQESTKEEAPDMGPGRAGLSCPGSSVVADEDKSNFRLEARIRRVRLDSRILLIPVVLYIPQKRLNGFDGC